MFRSGLNASADLMDNAARIIARPNVTAVPEAISFAWELPSRDTTIRLAFAGQFLFL